MSVSDLTGAMPTINTPLDFAHALEAALGAPQTASNDSVLVAWEANETGGGSSGWKVHNPLNIVSAPKGVPHGVQPGTGVASYSSWALGLLATVKQLTGGRASYAKIVDDLRANAPAAQTATDIGVSPWASGHYESAKHPQPGGGILASLGQAGTTPYPTGGSGGTVVQTTGFDFNPFNWPGDILGEAKKGVTEAGLLITFTVAGFALVVLGAWRTVSPTIQKATEPAKQAASAAGPALAAAAL